jgi:hypothetical protein
MVAFCYPLSSCPAIFSSFPPTELSRSAGKSRGGLNHQVPPWRRRFAREPYRSAAIRDQSAETELRNGHYKLSFVIGEHPSGNFAENDDFLDLRGGCREF